MKSMYIIAGCNGAGKTTAAYCILPEMLQCNEFVNVDEIARGLSPFHPESVSFLAGKLMSRRVSELMERGETFAVETTLAAIVYREKVLYAQSIGYCVTLIYFWLNSPELAKERVKIRVSEGGHDVPPHLIERRVVPLVVVTFDFNVPLLKVNVPSTLMPRLLLPVFSTMM